MSIVGYRIRGIYGEPGLAYDYIMDGNGLWIEANGPLMSACVLVAAAKIRGLPSYAARLELRHGKIPQRLWELALSVILASPEKERYVGILWHEGYQLYVPEQAGDGGRVEYLTGADVLVEFHSHPGSIGSAFSPIDDRDEQGFKIYGVVGELNERMPVVALRLGIYGYWMPIAWGDIFEGHLQGVIDIFDMLKKDEQDDLSLTDNQ